MQLNFKKIISCNNNKIYVQMLILCLSYFITTVPVVSEEIAAIRWVNLSFDLFQSLVVVLINQDWWSVIKNKMNERTVTEPTWAGRQVGRWAS